MIDRVFYLLAAVVKAVKRWARQREQEAAQRERDKISKDSAQYAAYKFGDGRVRRLEREANEADDSERADGDSR